MLQACSQGVDLKVDRHFGEGQVAKQEVIRYFRMARHSRGSATRVAIAVRCRADWAKLKCLLRLCPIAPAGLTGTVWNKKDSEA